MKNYWKILALLSCFGFCQAAFTQSQVDWFVFSKDYLPGTFDNNGQYLGGTELMRLTSHKGKLYASTSMFLDSFYVKRYNYFPGPQVLCKDSSKGKWRADLSLGINYMRADCLEQIKFNYDSTGQPLNKPVEILLAGIWDVSFDRQRMISVAILNDELKRWIISDIDTQKAKDQGSVRSMIAHRDKTTGIQYLFVGAGPGAIYKGVYDPSKDSKIRWVGLNELDFDAGRPQCMAICNDTLYAAFGYGDSQSPGDVGGLFKRIDGIDPKWELVYEWQHNTQGSKYEYLLRGITAVKDPENPDNEVIIGALEKPPKPVILRINPSKGYKAYEEVNYEEYFTQVFGATPNPNQYMNGALLNKLEPLINPETGESVNLVTTFIMHPQSPAKGYNGAYYMVRHSNGDYDWGAIYDTTNLPDGIELQGVRTMEKSPFPDEPNVHYFGGYAADYVNVENTAWIYKGTINKYTSLDEIESEIPVQFKLNQNYPNPFNPSTVISYQIPTAGHVTLTVYDVLGRAIATLVNEYKHAGSYNCEWRIDNGEFSSGVYFYRLSSAHYVEVKKMMVVK